MIVIESVKDTGPTDGHGDDTLYVAKLREPAGSSETVRFSVARTYGRPSRAELAELIVQRAAAFADDRGAVEQSRQLEFEHPEGSGRHVVFFRPQE